VRANGNRSLQRDRFEESSRGRLSFSVFSVPIFRPSPSLFPAPTKIRNKIDYYMYVMKISVCFALSKTGFVNKRYNLLWKLKRLVRIYLTCQPNRAKY
jgi:hypothetical protein